MSLLHQDVDFKLLLMRASIWKQGRAASIMATGQLCCGTPSKLVQEHPRATVGWLWVKIVVAALAFFPLPQLSVCPLSCGGTLRHVVFEAGLVVFHGTFSPTLPCTHIYSAEGMLRANQDNENWPRDPMDECSLPQHRNHSGWHMQISESLFFHSRILR